MFVSLLAICEQRFKRASEQMWGERKLPSRCAKWKRHRLWLLFKGHCGKTVGLILMNAFHKTLKKTRRTNVILCMQTDEESGTLELCCFVKCVKCKAQRRMLITGNVHKVGICSTEQSYIIRVKYWFSSILSPLSSQIKASHVCGNVVVNCKIQLILIGRISISVATHSAARAQTLNTSMNNDPSL